MKITFQNNDIAKNDASNVSENSVNIGKSEKSGNSGKAGASAYINYNAAGLYGSAGSGIRNCIGSSSNSRINRLSSDTFSSDGMLTSDAKGTNKGKNLADLQAQAGEVSVDTFQDFQTVMSNTMSAEDYAKASEEGFDYSSMDPEDVVTIQDKVKAEMAAGGAVIVGYNDNIDRDVLAEAVGSDTLARAISDSFSKANVPVTEENAEDLGKAWKLVSELKEPTDSELAYMVENELAPTIMNFYMAENSGSGNAGMAAEGMAVAGNSYVSEHIDLSKPENQTLRRQIIGLLQNNGIAGQAVSGQAVSGQAVSGQMVAGQAVAGQTAEGEPGAVDNDEIASGLQTAEWLLDRNLPVTAETINDLRKLQSVQFPVTEENFAESCAAAVAEGKNPADALLTETEDIYSKAAALTEKYFSDDIFEQLKDQVGDVTARRQLEEVRLSMTAEVNVKLLKSGFSIDTAPMEDMIKALKEAESQVAEKYFGKYGDSAGDEDSENSAGMAESVGNAVKNYRLMNETNRIVSDIKTAPAAAIGIFTSRNADDVTTSEFYEESSTRKDVYVKAGEAYETLMTTPRKDLGDSIEKAFVSVDSILGEIGIEATAENRRAARILGYNSMEITPENIDRVANADEKVTNIISKMTPASVLRMIRDGVNPLESSFAELEDYFDELENSNNISENNLEKISEYVSENNSEIISENTSKNNIYGSSYNKISKDYSEFLYDLEMQDGITDEERASFIGIYRMLHGIDKSKGAAVGAIVNENAELDFSNLLSAVRSSRFKGIDAKIDDSFGGTVDVKEAANSITRQIEAAYYAGTNGAGASAMENAAESGSAADAANLKDLRDAGDASRETYNTLKAYGILPSAENLNAAEGLLDEGNNIYAQLDSLMEKVAPDALGEIGQSINDRSENGRGINGRSENGRSINSRSVNSGKEDVLRNIAKNAEEGSFDDEELSKVNDELMQLAEEYTYMADSYVDVKGLSLIHRQLGIAGGLAGKDIPESAETGDRDYIIPFDLGDGISKVHLSFRSGDGDASLDVRVSLSEDSVAALHMNLDGDRLEGYFTGKNQDELQKMQEVSDIFTEALQTAVNNGGALGDLRVTEMPVISMDADGTIGSNAANVFGGTNGLSETNGLGGNLSTDNYRSKDAEGKRSDGTDRNILLQVAKIFLQSVRNA